MSEPTPADYGDPTTAPFWAAAARHELIVQRCGDCGTYQFYPRPFCLACQSDAVSWVPASGQGTVYSITTVRMPVLPELTPPYQVAVVTLAEGPRLLGGIQGDTECRIGDTVQVAWRDRPDAPPLPVWEQG